MRTTLPSKKSGSKFATASIWIGVQTPPALQTMYIGNRGIKDVNGCEQDLILFIKWTVRVISFK